VELWSDAMVLGGSGELQWTTEAGDKSWSTTEMRRVRRSRRRKAGRAEAWSSPRGGNGGGGGFEIRPETAAPTPRSRHTPSGSREGGNGLLRRWSAYMRKGGERWGVGGPFWTEQRGKRRGEGSVGPAGARGIGGGGVLSEGVHAEGGGGLAADGGGRRCGSLCGEETGEGRAWAYPRKEERRNGPAQGNSEIFYLFKRISKGSKLIRLKDGLSKF
jgi:hypothetical protein